jgi:aminoglycoside 6'-N-acetyltransferase I
LPTDIRVLRAGEEAILDNVFPGVFDNCVDRTAAPEFLADPRHHLAVAIEDGEVVAFASGVHYVHPDKPQPEMWINEVGVAESRRGCGLGKAVVQALLEEARRLGCAEAWVLTDRANAAAMHLYAACGGSEQPPDPVMFAFRLVQRPLERPVDLE